MKMKHNDDEMMMERQPLFLVFESKILSVVDLN